MPRSVPREGIVAPWPQRRLRASGLGGTHPWVRVRVRVRVSVRVKVRVKVRLHVSRLGRTPPWVIRVRVRVRIRVRVRVGVRAREGVWWVRV